MIHEKEMISTFDNLKFKALLKSLAGETNPIQRILGYYEMRNPSTPSNGILDRVGVDFMTNQPKYVTRTTTSFKGGEQ